MSKKLYLANPYGFSKQTKTLLHEFIEIFNDLNVDVFEPFERAKPITQKESKWAYDVARSNFNDLKECKNLKMNTNCSNEQVVALLSVIASNFAITNDKK